MVFGLSYRREDLSHYDRPVSDHTGPNNDWFYSHPIYYINVDRYTETLVNKCKGSERLFNSREICLVRDFNRFSVSSLISLIERRVDLTCIIKLQYDDSTETAKILLRLKARNALVFPNWIYLLHRPSKLFKQLPRFDRIQRVSSRRSTELMKDFIRVSF